MTDDGRRRAVELWFRRRGLPAVVRARPHQQLVLPLLLLFTTFGFFTAEIWQVAGALPRRQLWLVVGLFVVVGMLHMLSVLSDELRALGSAQRDEQLAEFAGVPVYNGLTDTSHPTQTLCDVFTMLEHCRKPVEPRLGSGLQAAGGREQCSDHHHR